MQRGEITVSQGSRKIGTVGFFQLLGAYQMNQAGGIWTRSYSLPLRPLRPGEFPISHLPKDALNSLCGNIPQGGWQLSRQRCLEISKDPLLGPCIRTAGNRRTYEIAACNGRLVVAQSGKRACGMTNAVAQVQ